MDTHFTSRAPPRRVFRYAFGLAAFFVGSWVLRDVYGGMSAPLPLSPQHLASRMPSGEWWPPRCRAASYVHKKPFFGKVDQVECHPLLETAFVDAEIYPPLPRPGWDCAEGNVTACPVEWITYATHCTLGLNRLAISAHRAGIPFTVLGHGTGWVGWGYRLRLLHDYIINVPDDRVIVFTDADDVILAPSCTAPDIISGFEAFNVPVLFPAEVACYPKGELATYYTTLPSWKDESITPFHYLNAGVMVGKAGMWRALLRKMYIHDCFDDQLLYTYAYISELSYYKDEQHNLKLSERRPLASFAPDVFPPFDENAPPASAKPVMGLDMMNDLIVAMYDVFHESLSFPEGEIRHPSSDQSLDHGGRTGYGTAKHVGTATQTGTGGTPCIFHQSGNKSGNNVLELLARKWGMLYDAKKLTKDELKWWGARK